MVKSLTSILESLVRQQWIDHDKGDTDQYVCRVCVCVCVCVPLSQTLLLVDSDVEENWMNSYQTSLSQFQGQRPEGLRGQRELDNQTAPEGRSRPEIRENMDTASEALKLPG